ncbi:MAG: hypothetical protein O3A46_16015 [Candidatus Poribacteria bacterium]|nr:hypothetical protein [Candidatus Poribacteria bacterium]
MTTESISRELDTWFRWAREIRSWAFLHPEGEAGESWGGHVASAAERIGLGRDGYRQLFETAQMREFIESLDATDVPSDLNRKDSTYFVITTKCNNGIAFRNDDDEIEHKTCGHCLNGSGPNGVSMTFEDIDRTVANLPHLIREIEISGGEVLHPEALPLTLHTIRRCRERFGRDLLLSIQTNGDFFRNRDHTKRLVGELRDAGLRRIVVASMDIYHGRGNTDEEKFEERKRHYARVAENLRQEGVRFVGSSDFQSLSDDPKVLTAHFFGADIQDRFSGFIVDDLVPNARAVRAGLVSEMDHGVKYCRNHAGARGFLGSDTDDQVAINGGAVYPCCWFTEFPLGDARAIPIPKLLMSYIADPLALAQHLGDPHRAWEIASLIDESLSEELREIIDGQRELNECVGCRNVTTEYANLMRRRGYALYERLWRDIPVMWNHRTDPEHDLQLNSWVAPSARASA